MKLALNLSIFLFALVIFGDKSLSLTDFQIRRICKKERKELACIKILKEKRFNLQKGKLIEIPVIPYQKR
tara:strand:+ start:389 stop:598 length:210 start_codon:yes stop_codon:yes gene_type:complete